MSANKTFIPGIDNSSGYEFPSTCTTLGSVGGIKVALDKDFAAPHRRQLKEHKRDSQLESVLNNITPGQGTMLHLASKLGNADVVRALLISGADPSVLDEEGVTAYDSSFSEQVTKVYHDVLLQAVAQSNMVLASNLLKAGVDVNIQDDEATGNTALHWAACYGNKDTVKLLIDNKADINAANVYGATPLHDAVARADVDIIYELVANGANRKAKANQGKFAGKTPMSMAEGKPKIKKALEGVQLANGNIKTAAEAATPKPKPVSPLTPLTPVNDEDIQQQLSDLLNAQKLSGQSQPSPVTDEKFQLLWPKPQSMIKRSGDPLKLKPHFLVRVAAGPSASNDYLQQMVDIWSIHGPLLGEMGFKCILECAVRPEYPDPFILCQYVPNLFTGKDQYRITVTDKQMIIQCSDFSGLWNASCTVVQLIRLFNEEGIPAVQISDWPDLRYRGVSLDISCGRVPKLDYLMHVVNILTLMKFNELHLHMKSVEGEEVEGVMPYSESELLDLEIYCRWRYMDVIPHLDVSSKTELTSKQMSIFKQILSSFGSTSSVNIGANLTKKLLATPSDTSDDKDASPLAQLDVRDCLHLLGIKDNHNVRFCANELDFSQEALARLPVGSMTLHYGCKVDYDYSAACTALTEAGMAFSVCPGTAAWDSVVGCPEAAIRNIHNAVLSATASPNAVGLLLTDWSGSLHINQPTFSFPGFATASGLAWNKNIPMDFITSRLADIINHYFFLDGDCVLGQVIVELGRAETFLTRSAWSMLEGQLSDLPNKKGTFLCQLITKPDEVDLEHVTPEVIQKTLNHLHKIQRSLESAKKTPVQEFAIVELQLATDIMLWASRVARILVVAGKKPNSASVGSGIVNVGLANANATAKTDSANKLLSIMDMYRKVWLHTNHTSGLLECLEVFNHILEKLIPKNMGLQNGEAGEDN